ncbi:hypothetical protein EV188_102892 [Actinomycetospora succinea]|uniref:PH (Pleckstrin Homology) domain-containing protein n=1 Tax=Actinomycetospora succinea TaxID=663603 RepID=A0A4R6VMP1_9PSEU|nr:hypothetical protein [Actinomycetospora succinea]TDQ63235.1 hypothetical protein EV188_102892 [Actinomycetospora succinea]
MSLQGRIAESGQLAGPMRPEHRAGSVSHHGPGVQAIRRDILEGEQIYGIFGDRHGPTALIGVTNRRVLFMDAAYDDGRVALTSVPLKQIVSCSYITTVDQPVTEATVVGIKVGRNMFEVSCVSPEEAQDVHGLIMWHLIGL